MDVYHRSPSQLEESAFHTATKLKRSAVSEPQDVKRAPGPMGNFTIREYELRVRYPGLLLLVTETYK